MFARIEFLLSGISPRTEARTKSKPWPLQTPRRLARVSELLLKSYYHAWCDAMRPEMRSTLTHYSSAQAYPSGSLSHSRCNICTLRAPPWLRANTSYRESRYSVLVFDQDETGPSPHCLLAICSSSSLPPYEYLLGGNTHFGLRLILHHVATQPQQRREVAKGE